MAIFDAHLHIIDPRFPLIENNGFLPDAFSVSDYLAAVSPLGVVAGAVVSGSFQGFDQTYLMQALSDLGENFVGVTQVPFSTSDDELASLHEHGVRALRFNLFRGGSEDHKYLPDYAKRVFELFGWHVELYAGYESLSELSSVIKALPKVSIDNLGMNDKSIPLLKEFVDEGVFVKATGFGRIDFPPLPAMRGLYEQNPGALVFGTDMPSTRAKIPFSERDYYSLSDEFSASEVDNICWHNALRLYSLNIE